MSELDPSAFPVNSANLGGPGAYEPEPGMSLRDWFAGQAPAMPDGFRFPGYPSEYISDSEWTQERQDAAVEEARRALRRAEESLAELGAQS